MNAWRRAGGHQPLPMVSTAAAEMPRAWTSVRRVINSEQGERGQPVGADVVASQRSRQ
jgi:hypothetical protein